MKSPDEYEWNVSGDYPVVQLNKFKTSDSYDDFCDYLVKNASETGIDVNDEVYIANSSNIINGPY